MASDTPLKDEGEEFAQALSDMVEQVWKAKGMPEELISKPVTAQYARQLWNGVTEGYGAIAEKFNTGTIDYTTPDFDMLASLQSNIWTFSAAKNYTQLRQLSQALIGDDGKLRNYRSFREAAMIINNTHKDQYLKAEYKLAVAGGQMASKWVQIKENEGTLNMLEFDAVMDRRTSEICRPLNGTVLPVSDPFWSMYYPPNHFGCRSTVRQRAGRAATPHHDIPSAEIPPMFRTNLAANGLIFPEGHAYFVDLPSDVTALKSYKKELKNEAKRKFLNKNFTTPDGLKASLNITDIDKVLTQGVDDKWRQLALFNCLPKLIENAEFVSEAQDYSGNVKRYIYYKVKGVKNCYLNFRENHKGEITFYTIKDKIRPNKKS